MPAPRTVLSTVLAATSFSAGQPACAQDTTPSPPPDKSAYTLLNPTPREFMRDLSTDRPDTTESAYTVDAGHAQIELSFVDFTFDGYNDAGQTVRSLAVAPMLLKLGLLNNVDIQLGLTPFEYSHTSGAADSDGFGDAIIRLKINLWGNDTDGTALAIMPFVSLPTAADGLGSGRVEGGIILPFAAPLPAGFNLGAMLEFDFIRSDANDRYVVDLVHTLTVGHAITDALSGYVEFAGFANLNHDEDYRAYFDAGLTYQLTDDLQFDAGIRLGLTKAADDLGLFAGVSVRF